VVSDNASRDGTDAVVAEAAAAGLSVTYHRNERDLGATRNIAQAVALADADWCWLLSSDDVLLPGAVDRVLELLAAHPGVTGVTVNQLVLDRTLTAPLREQATPAVPALHAVTVLRGLDDIVGELGWIMSGLSSQIVRRDPWIAAEAALRERMDRTPTWYPHTAVMLRMAAAAPTWLWCPAKLAGVRAQNPDPVVLHPRFQGELLRDIDVEWRAAVGRRGDGRRRVLARYRCGLDTVGALALIAADGQRGWRDSAWLLWRFARVFGRSLEFWRRDAPQLVVPSRLAGRRQARAPRGGPAAGSVAAVLDVTLPAVVGRADLLRVGARVENRGRARWRRGQAVATARWTGAGGATHDGGETVLRARLRPGRARDVALVLTAPPEPGEWRLRVALGDAATEADVTVAP